jgi:hypothetical protein
MAPPLGAPLDWPPPPGDCADAKATLANSAAVLIKSLVLIGVSSFPTPFLRLTQTAKSSLLFPNVKAEKDKVYFIEQALWLLTCSSLKKK